MVNFSGNNSFNSCSAWVKACAHNKKSIAKILLEVLEHLKAEMHSLWQSAAVLGSILRFMERNILAKTSDVSFWCKHSLNLKNFVTAEK